MVLGHFVNIFFLPFAVLTLYWAHQAKRKAQPLHQTFLSDSGHYDFRIN